MRSLRPLSALVLPLVASAACAGDAPDAEDPAGRDASAAVPDVVPRLEMAPEPSLEIGAVAGDEDYLFDEIVTVLRLPSGDVAVADAGRIRVSLFTPDGELIRHVGRRGEGPGELRGLARIYPHGSDSLLAVDAWGGAVSAFSTAGDFGRRIEPVSLSGDSTFRLDAWLYGSFWVEGALAPTERERARKALDRLPSPPRGAGQVGYRLVRVDDEGRLWVREPGLTGEGARRWIGMDGTGRPATVLDVPARFAPTQIREGEILGRWRGESDVNFVRVHPLRESGETAPVPAWYRGAAVADPPDPDATEEELMAHVRSAVKQMASAQEIHYSRRYSYTSEIDSLEWEPEEGVAADVVAAHNRGWSGVFVHASLDRICGLGYGSAVPPGWNPGMVHCSDPRPASPASASGG